MIDTQTDWIDLYRLLEHTNNGETNSQQDGPHHLFTLARHSASKPAKSNAPQLSCFIVDARTVTIFVYVW